MKVVPSREDVGVEQDSEQAVNHEDLLHKSERTATHTPTFSTWAWPLLCAMPLAVIDVLVPGLLWFLGGYLIEGFEFTQSLRPISAMLLATLPLFGLLGLYGLPVHNPVQEVRLLTLGLLLLVGLAAAVLVSFPGPVPVLLPIQVVLTLSASVVFVSWLRGGLRRLLSRSPAWGASVVLVGPKESVDEVLKAREGSAHGGLRIVDVRYGFPARHDLARLAGRASSSWALIAVQGMGAEAREELVRRYEGSLPHLAFMGAESAGWEESWGRRFQIGAMSGVVSTTNSLTLVARVVRRALSLILVVPGLLLGAPLFLGLALAVKCTSSGPVFYGQERIGRGARRFLTWKFRTMVQDADVQLAKLLESDPTAREEWERDHKLRKDPRITTVGGFLRRTSLDELPQLWNVFVGDMNLVGPRPIVEDEIEKYGEAFLLYGRVTPGLTGLWQVSGRNNTTYEKRVRLDTFYVRNWTPWLDLWVLLRTVPVLLRREGAC